MSLDSTQILTNYQSYTSFLSKIQKLFTHYLYKNSEALQYVYSRQINDDYIQYYKLGFDPGIEKIKEFVTMNQFPFELLYDTRILITKEDKEYDVLSERIVFPLEDVLGNITGFSGRIWTKEQETLYASKYTPKYINTSSSDIFSKSLVLYNLRNAAPFIRKQNYCILVEGMIDVISLFMRDIRNVVAPCGTSLTQEHVYLLKYFTDEVIILYDGDEPGKKSASKVFELLTKTKISAHVVSLPSGDPDSFIKQFDKDYLLRYISDNRTA